MRTEHDATANESAPILVTGSSGFIGGHLVESLSRNGQAVVGVDRRPPRALDAGDGRAPVRQIQDDLRFMELKPLLDGVSTVIHLAALPGVRPSWERFEEYVETNVLVTRRLLEAAAAAGVSRLVVASSSSVYGNRSTGSMAEDQVTAPASPYAVTKLAAERLALAYSARPDSRMTTVALRFFTVYGPGQRPDMLISRIISAVLDGTELRVFGDGSQRRDFVFIDDVVAAVTAAARAPIGDQVVNVGTGRDTSVTETIRLVGELLGRAPVLRTDRQQAGDVTLTRADPSRAAELLGFRSTVSLREGLVRHIESMRSPVPSS